MTLYFLGKYPGTIYFKWLLVLEVVTIFKRFLYYKSLGWHYFLVDFCYFSNLMIVLFVFLFPTSKEMYLFCYFTCSGVLAFAIYVFRNSFIFHHIDKLTDLVIHLLPLVTIWNIHWNLRNSESRQEWGFLNIEELKLDFQFIKDCIMAFNYFYIIWASFYYIFIMGIRRKRITEKNYWTLIDMQVDQNKFATKLKKNYGMWAAWVYFFSESLYLLHC